MPKKDPILQAGAPLLRAVAKPVPAKDIGSASLHKIIARMRAALKPEENGVAIAAPQIGEPLRIFVVSGKVFAESEHAEPALPGHKPGRREASAELPDMVFINPELVRASRKKSAVSEGCLSVRGVYGMVRRSDKATVRALDERGKPFTYHGSGLVAQIFQHEIDHLSGVLFTDKAEKIDDESHP